MPETVLIFVARWASAICDPYQRVVRSVASRLGLLCRAVDVEEFPETWRTYGFMNMPAVALESDTNRSAIIGARAADDLASLLEERLSR